MGMISFGNQNLNLLAHLFSFNIGVIKKMTATLIKEYQRTKWDTNPLGQFLVIIILAK